MLPRAEKRFHLKKLIPLLLLLILLIVAWYLDLFHYLSFSSLQQHRELLIRWTEQRYLLVVLGFMLIYIIAVACSIPGATFLTLASGFLFGVWLGTLYVVVSATLGATLIFLAVRLAFREWFANKAAAWLKKMEQGFQRDAVSYLLFLRLVPLFPFWLVNIVPALFDISIGVFILTTLLGIIPGSLVYVAVGNGLSQVFAVGATPDLKIIFKPYILLPILGLALLSLLPIIYRYIKGRKSHV